MTTLQEILTAAEMLPANERAQLLAALWDKTSPADWMYPTQECFSEANRRSDALDSGQMTSSSWSDVRQRARKKAGLDD